MMLNKQQGYLPPLLVSILLVIQANYLSGHRSRHTGLDSDEEKPDIDSSPYSFPVLKDKSKHWTEKWETAYYRNEEKPNKENPDSKDVGFYQVEAKGKAPPADWEFNEQGKNQNRKYT